MSECGCKKAKSAKGTNTSAVEPSVPSLEPPREFINLNGENTMSESKPTLIPPAEDVSEIDADVGTAEPTLTPGSMASEGGITAWVNDKRISALWSKNDNRNSWVYITSVGWKKLADNSDSAVVALSLVASHAKQTQTSFNYREESDGKIHEMYVW